MRITCICILHSANCLHLHTSQCELLASAYFTVRITCICILHSANCLHLHTSQCELLASAYFIVRITCICILHSANYLHLHTSQCELLASPRPYFEVSKTVNSLLSKVLAVKLNRIGNKQNPCLTPLPIFILLVSPWSSFCLTFRSMYNLLFNPILSQSIVLTYRICINLVHFTWSNDFYQSTKQTRNYSSVSKVRSDIIPDIQIASPIALPLLYPH